MKRSLRHIGLLLGGMLMLLLGSACSSSSDDGLQYSPDGPVLELSLMAPSRSVVTRSDIGYVNADYDEDAINTLDVWAFETGTETLVGYLHLTNITFESNNRRTINLKVTDEFAAKPVSMSM